MKWTELVQGAEMAKEAQWAKGLKKNGGVQDFEPLHFFSRDLNWYTYQILNSEGSTALLILISVAFITIGCGIWPLMVTICGTEIPSITL